MGLAMLLISTSWGSAHAQTKLVKPASGGTLVISKSGSYFLAANYTSTLPAASIISITVSNVTINLNGFTISDTTLNNTAPAISVNSPTKISGVTIANGTITKTGTAISLGTSSAVGSMQLIGNKGDGVDCTSTCLISNNVITGNTGVGLNFGSDATSGYQSNVMNLNGTDVMGGTNLGHNVCSGAACPAPGA
jgi:hypothetical protein